MRKIIFGLAREQSQSDEDSQRDDEGLHDDTRVVEGGHDADGVGFEGSKAGQEQEVCRVGFTFPVRQEHKSDCADERDDHEPEVGLDPGAVRVAEKRDAAEDGCEEDLHGPMECKQSGVILG